jgi:DNA ligase-1
MKLKPTIEIDCKCVSVIEGEGKYKGMLGAIMVKQTNGKLCKVGSGFKDDQRKDFWKHPKKIVKMTVEVKYKELTADGVMREPIFVQVRYDK